MKECDEIILRKSPTGGAYASLKTPNVSEPFPFLDALSYSTSLDRRYSLNMHRSEKVSMNPSRLFSDLCDADRKQLDSEPSSKSGLQGEMRLQTHSGPISEMSTEGDADFGSEIFRVPGLGEQYPSTSEPENNAVLAAWLSSLNTLGQQGVLPVDPSDSFEKSSPSAGIFKTEGSPQ